jgi:hypothetical protein
MESFEAFWSYLQVNLKPGTDVKNWTAFNGYLGNKMTIVGVYNQAVEVDAPKAKTIQVVPIEDFKRVWQVWLDYKANKVRRYELRDLTRFSKYIISILHWYESES